MRYFDLHCDTIGLCEKRKAGLYKNKLHISLKKAEIFEQYIQCYAAFIPDSLQGDEAFFYFCKLKECLDKELEKNKEIISRCREVGDLKKLSKKFGAIFTVENAKAIGGKIENLHKLGEYGVKAITLTWNAENELGAGVRAVEEKGLTAFGREVLTEMNEMKMVPDLSHASEQLFYETAEFYKKPFLITHSNAKKVCKHPRNLTDDQFKLVRDRKGLVGLNFYNMFLNDEPKKATITDVFRHAEHFLSLGGEDTLAMGSDFDGGIDLPKGMKNVSHVKKIQEFFLKQGYAETLVDKIFYGNAMRFFTENNLL